MTKRGVLTVGDLRERSVLDESTRCWNWQGARSSDGTPRIWTLDYGRAEKRCISGASAVWNIAHNKSPGWRIAYRRCCNVSCVNPVHIALADSKAEIGLHISRNGCRKGKQVEQRTRNLEKAWAAQGIKVTPPDVVASVRGMPDTMTLKQIAEACGVNVSTASYIRRGDRRASVGLA